MRDKFKCKAIDLLEKDTGAPTGEAQWVGHRPTKQRVASSIPSWDIRLVCGLDPRIGCVQEATPQCCSLTSVFLSLSFSLPPSLPL